MPWSRSGGTDLSQVRFQVDGEYVVWTTGNVLGLWQAGGVGTGSTGCLSVNRDVSRPLPQFRLWYFLSVPVII